MTTGCAGSPGHSQAPSRTAVRRSKKRLNSSTERERKAGRSDFARHVGSNRARVGVLAEDALGLLALSREHRDETSPHIAWLKVTWPEMFVDRRRGGCPDSTDYCTNRTVSRLANKPRCTRDTESAGAGRACFCTPRRSPPPRSSSQVMRTRCAPRHARKLPGAGRASRPRSTLCFRLYRSR